MFSQFSVDWNTIWNVSTKETKPNRPEWIPTHHQDLLPTEKLLWPWVACTRPSHESGLESGLEKPRERPALQHILQGGSRSSWLVFILSYLLVLQSFRLKPFAAGWCMSLEKASCLGAWKEWSWTLLRMWSACALQMFILYLQLTCLLKLCLHSRLYFVYLSAN